MTHNISNFKLYPVHHIWTVNPSKLNLYANLEVCVGDKIKLKDKEFTVKAIDFKQEDPISQELLTDYIRPTTNFYTLIIE